MEHAQINFRRYCDKLECWLDEHIPSEHNRIVVRGIGVAIIVIICGLNFILPCWLQYLIVLVAGIMVWSFLFSDRSPKPTVPPRTNFRPTNYSVTTNSKVSEAPDVTPIRSGVESLRVAVPDSTTARISCDPADEMEESSISGTVGGTVSIKPRREKEPLDPVTLSSVTSPGFTSRIVQKRDNALLMNRSLGGSPLRESNSLYSSLINSPNSFSRSPSQMIGKPMGPFKPAPTLNPPSFTSPTNGAKYSASYRRRKQDPYGTSYIPMASVESINQSLNASASAAKPTIGPPGATMINDRVATVAYAGGIGGFSASPGSPNRSYPKLWSPPVSGPVDGMITYESPRRAPSPVSGSPVAGTPDSSMSRKRNRFVDSMGDKRSSPIRSSSSVYLTPTEDILKQGSKRTKFVQSSSDLRFNGPSTTRGSPYMTLTDLPPDDSMTTESILEQMNQTEKRFLPDDSSTPVRSPRKSKSGAFARGSSDSAVSPFRKRRIPSHSITTLMDEEQSERGRGFCECTECYNEAAGLSKLEQDEEPQLKTSVVSIPSVKRKKLVSFHNQSLTQYEPTHQGVVKAAVKPTADEQDITQKFTPVRMQIITKAKYEADKKKRQERLARMIQDSSKKSEAKGSPVLPPGDIGDAREVTNLSAETSISGGNDDQVDGEKPASIAAVASSMNIPAVTSAAAISSASSLSFGATAPQTASSAITPTVTNPTNFTFGSTTSSVKTSMGSIPEKKDNNAGFKGFGAGGTSASERTTAVPSTSATPTVTGPVFGVSAAPSSKSDATPSFSFGSAPQATAAVSNNTTTFSFGNAIATPTASVANESAKTSSGETSAAPATASFSFGSNSTNVSSTAVSAPSSSFTFGNTSAISTPDVSISSSSNSLFGAKSAPPAVSTTAGSLKAADGNTVSFGSADSKPQSATTQSSDPKFTFGAPSSNLTFGQSNANSLTPSTTSPSSGSTSFASVTATSLPSLVPAFGQTPVTTAQSSSTATANSAAPALAFSQSNVSPNTSGSNTSGPFSFGSTVPSVSSPAFGSNTQITAPPATTTAAAPLFGQSSFSQASSGPAFGTKPPESTSAASSFGNNTFAFGNPSGTGANPSSTASTALASGQNTATPIFGQTSNASGSSGSIFGSNTTSASPFGPLSVTPSFGVSQPSAGGAGVFGSSSGTSFGSTGSGSSTNTAVTNSTFGANGSSSIFGNQSSSSSSFGVPSQNPTFGTTVSSPAPAFGATTTAPPAFGATVTSATSPFGTSNQNPPPAYGSTPQTQTNSLFGSTGQTSTPTFGSSGVSSPFGGGSTSQPSTIFGQSNSSGSSAFAFGQNTTQQSANSPFGGASQQQSKPLFGDASSSNNNTSTGFAPFGQANQSSNGTAFGFGSTTNASPSPAFGSSFGQPSNTAFAAQSPPAGGAFQFGQQSTAPGAFNFGAQAQQPPIFGANQGAMFTMGASSSSYSRSQRSRARGRR